MDIDLYQLAKCVDRCADEDNIDWVLANGREKAAFIVTIDDNMPQDMREELIEAGNDMNDDVIVIIQ
jgi:precorrin-6B methylase 1